MTSTLNTSPPPTWSEEAEERMERVHPFVRPMVRDEIERYAREKGYRVVTPHVIDAQQAGTGGIEWTPEAKKRLENIPSFVRSMARKEIERMAVQRGETTITESLMDEAKERFLGLRGVF